FRGDPRGTWARLPPGGTTGAPLQLLLELGMANVDEAELTDAAFAAFEQLAAVGLTERFGESITHFNVLLGCALSLPSAPENVTLGRPPVSALDAETLEVIRNLTRVDDLLYREACKRFPPAYSADE